MQWVVGGVVCVTVEGTGACCCGRARRSCCRMCEQRFADQWASTFFRCRFCGHLIAAEAAPTGAEEVGTSRPGPWRRGSGGGEAVADAGFGFQPAGGGGVVAELEAKLAHDDAQVVRVLRMRGAPDFAEDLLLADDAAGVTDEQREHREFLARERDGAAVEEHFA